MKYKYYFRKPKSEIAKDVLYWLLLAGGIFIAATSPFFLVNLTKGIIRWKKYKKYHKKRVRDTFYSLKKRGLIEFVHRNHQVYIRLTEKGKRVANWMQIDALEIKKPKKWDRKWRIIVFDISELKRIYRDAFRGKLKELGFYQLQKSVWVHPFDCRDEIALLRDFFGLKKRELRLIVAEKIDEDRFLRKIFDL